MTGAIKHFVHLSVIIVNKLNVSGREKYAVIHELGICIMGGNMNRSGAEWENEYHDVSGVW